MKVGFRPIALGALLVNALSCSSGTPPGPLADGGSFCTDDDQCPAGTLCLGGICQTPQDAGGPPDAPPGPPEIVVDPTSLDFGSALLGAEVTLVVEISNLGESPLHVTNLQLIEVDALPEYSADPAGPVALEILPGESTLVQVTLRQQDDEVDVGELRIASDDADEPLTVVSLTSDIKGTPQLTVTPDAIDYGTVAWGTAPTQDVDVTNTGTGNAPLIVTAATVTNDTGLGGAFTVEAFLIDPTTGGELATTLPAFLSSGDAVTPGGILRLRVNLDTATLGSGELPDEDLVVATNDADPTDAQKHVPISGQVLGCAVPGAEVCDGADNDCDLLVDEDDPGGGVGCFTGVPGECADGLLHCVGGTLECVETGGPIAEVCDGLDNDCDGSADEALVQSCTTACGTGVEFCVGGSWLGCNAPAPQAESCDGVDNDCDGITDEGDPGSGSPCATGQPGVCGPGTIHCVGGAPTCVRNVDPSAEACDAEDDDCDGTVDEGWGLGTPCDGADADGCAEGGLVCDGTGAGTTCSDATSDNVEVCNGLDDDCDGTIDEGFALGVACDGGDADLCAEGVTVCNGTGTGTTCNDATPNNVELCDGNDDDCDGTIDEGYDLGVACDGGDLDLCTEGLTVCNAAGTGTACNDATGNNPETCNGLDDDCDGTTDEGFVLGTACDGGDADLCAEGVRVCNAAGTGTACDDATSDNAEACNGVDDDCDGATDEGLGLGVACDGADGDACNEGVTVCNAAGTGTECNDATTTNAEACNGADDDCDGSIDEGFALGAACDGPDGDLCAEGITVCNGTGTGTTCNDATPANVEYCNAADDDCDGSTDEGYDLGVACDGPDADLCTDGMMVCNGAGTGTVCNDGPGFNAETCNGIDDDCDGSTDEGYTLGAACDGPDGDLCAEGVTVCNAAGTGTTCNDATATNIEACNGVDEDCDGATDEGFSLGVACDGGDVDLCNEGVTICDGPGTGTTCNDATASNVEYCNGADDDCDGVTDEGFVLGLACDGTDGDQCAEGETVCNGTGSGTICNDTGATNIEYCNAVDDDCDGSTDEGYALGVACDGADPDFCNEGVTVCNGAGTGTECNDATGANPEVCNGLDDDCDGLTDEGFTLGAACDGPDADLCSEGVTVCNGAGTGTTCTDATGDLVDTCNGVDDDCDAASVDGAEDPALGSACDGADSDLCIEGVRVCTAGALACNDNAAEHDLDVCNGADDDCDPASGDGSEDPLLGTACDGADSDLCAEGARVCTAGALACNDVATEHDLDVCNGADDDCDPASGDGSEDPLLGTSCDGADSDLCAEGARVCSSGALACNDNATEHDLDVCNGADDDCDAASGDGSEDPLLGTACDGGDSDLCAEGARVCTAGALACTDATGSTVDVCNGLDDDCDALSGDGSEDPLLGTACDGADTDLCSEGTRSCSGGTLQCSDATGSTTDVCNGLDDDCDAASADGSEDPLLGTDCDGTDSDLCNEGTRSCGGAGTLVCSDATGSTTDVCNGLDDDCDGGSADGSEDPLLGTACDGADSDLCAEGARVCTSGALACNDVATEHDLDVCNGSDDDCDAASADGTEDPLFGTACDGADSDLCAEGARVCTSGALACNDAATEHDLDVCNGADDDCDSASADGAEDPLLGTSCDGADSDLCAEGARVCTSGALACNDVATEHDLDVCNGADDDCDAASADGSEDPAVGAACDGPDSDLCTEGTRVCSGGALDCTDTSGGTIDVCNGVDDDCDGLSGDGSEDPLLGSACDGADTDLCTEGTRSCSGGTFQCSDTTGSTTDVCNGADDDCDPASADGAEDPLLGSACDGTDSDLCNEGTRSCGGGGTLVCSDGTGSTTDVCNGSDDDCDPASADGAEDPLLGTACDGADSDLCAEGARVCTLGALACNDVATEHDLDVCNGSDDDCDSASADGAEDPLLGTACDGADSDLCAEGARVCSSGALACNDVATEHDLDLCNGANDDCDAASADGSEDPALGAACDGPDSDLCTEGTRVCTAGALDCTDATGGLVDVCNGLDDDCDSASSDGAEDPLLGSACDGPDSDLCTEGTRSCGGGTLQCSDATGSTTDVCNGSDDDCDSASADGSEDPLNGTACDGTDSDLCPEGTRSCSGGALACSDVTGSTNDVCNGSDDDCDSASADGAEDPLLGTSCDGADSDLCAEGTRVCTTGTLTCNDPATEHDLDVCNGSDDDCDSASADGAEDPLNGTSCDGADGDLCQEGTRSCSGGALVCSDATGTTSDVCNGADDDCDPASADGAEDPLNGTSCDGPDSDLCTEGTRSCSTGVLVCSDATGSTVDLCNGANDDCDPASADGAEDPLNGTSCDGADSDLCQEGTRSCSGGALVCSDATSSTADVCNGSDDDCDSASADGSEDPLNGTACDGGDSDLCPEGTRYCGGGILQCNDGTGSTVDVCNGADDDCDGASADGSEDPLLGSPCDGADADSCQEGVRVCPSGSLVCNDPNDADPEVCNGGDDDCDGPVDEGGAALCPPTANVATTSCGGASGCQVASCNGGWFNVNGGYGDGCECGEDYNGASCGSATNLGSLGAGASVPAGGKIVSAGAEDWFVVAFPCNADFSWHCTGTPRVTFSQNDGDVFRFDVYPACGSGAMGCQSGSASASGLTDWAFNDTWWECYWDGFSARCGTRSWGWPETAYVRVYRTSGGASCANYSLSITR